MRVEDRSGVMENKPTPKVICICEDETESKIIDKLGKIGGKVVGVLCLADGYGEFYIDLKSASPNKREKTNNPCTVCSNFKKCCKICVDFKYFSTINGR